MRFLNVSTEGALGHINREERKRKIEIPIRCQFCGFTGTAELEVYESIGRGITLKEISICDDCGEKRRNAEYLAAAADRWRQLAIAAGVPEKRLDWDKSKGNVDLMKFLWNNRNRSCTVLGDYGCGKTWALCGAIGAILRDSPMRRVRFWNFNDLAAKYSSLLTTSLSAAEDFRRDLVNYDLLVIDDFGKKRLNATALDFFYSVVNRIYEQEGKIWISYNVPPSILIPKCEDQDIAMAIFDRLRRMNVDGALVRWEDGK